MELKEKAAYLKGLVEGLGIDETTKEGKVIKAMSELLCEMAQAVDGIDEDVTQAYDQINDLSEELDDLEADLYARPAARPCTSARTTWMQARPSAPAARSPLRWLWPTTRSPKRTTAPCSTR